MDKYDESDYIVPESGTIADKAHFLANVQGVAFCYLLGGAAIKNFRFVDRINLQILSKEINDLWEETLFEVKRYAPYDFSRIEDY